MTATEWIGTEFDHAMVRANLYLNMYVFAACPQCKATWDCCLCAEREARFKVAFERKWEEMGHAVQE